MRQKAELQPAALVTSEVAPRPTIRDVARVAGVAVSTVSYVVNDSGHVSPETRLRVTSAIRALRYEPNTMARNLKTGKASSIGLIAPDLANPYFAAVAAGVQEAAQASDILLVLCTTQSQPHWEDYYSHVVRARRLDGLIFLSGSGMLTASLLELIQRGLVVLVDEKLPGLDVPAVTSNNRRGARAVAGHVLDMGHRRIGIIGGPPQLWTAEQRLSGYREALAGAGIDPDGVPILHGDYQQASGMVAARALLDVPAAERPTALLCANDMMAIGAMLCCREMGLRIPGDVSVVGFDDIPMAELMEPGLTSVRQSGHALGRAACRLLLRRINPHDGKDEEEVITNQPTTLIPRGSVGAPARQP
ncbi:LacI family DNA-binding transcriptional regulator [Acidisoma cladoniae]|jgi:DNA-binding LacI/PurR family transcriptional regulator|uniref:LacI family DNA-binding transcriptional regulator n=1 Tax=Acidisoma cladoniae TaxID=3040935 RepID=UPI00254BAFFA|nr:LacI family DNA-binding transcriptional regulator [Acidisoma sp. PAMC 29798]